VYLLVESISLIFPGCSPLLLKFTENSNLLHLTKSYSIILSFNSLINMLEQNRIF